MTGWTTANVLTPLATGPVTGTWLRGDPTGTTNNYGSQGQPETGHASTNCLFTAQNTSDVIQLGIGKSKSSMQWTIVVCHSVKLPSNHAAAIRRTD